MTAYYSPYSALSIILIFLLLACARASESGPDVYATIIARNTQTAAPTATVKLRSYFVGNTDGDGVYIRRTPNMEDKIRAWPDGTEMIRIGHTVTANGRSWRHVHDPDGNKGFVPTQYLVNSITGLTPAATQCTTATKAYLKDLFRRLTPITNSRIELVRLMKQGDQSSATTPEEFGEFVTYLALIQASSEIILEEVMPPSDSLAQSLHSKFLRALELFASGAEQALSGLAEDNKEEFVDGMSKVSDRGGRALIDALNSVKRECGDI